MAVAIGAMGVLAGVLASGGLAAATVSRSSDQPALRAPSALMAPLTVPILMYHYVNETPPPTGPDAASLTVSPAQFEAEMDYLAGHGYHPVTMADIYAAMSGDGRLPSRPVAITFDDGGLDGYAVALPILRAHGFRATFFVITGYVGNGSCMTWDQLREMSAAGMAIESHTFAHPDLRRIDAARLANELRRSRNAIASELGVDARFLSYPNGRYDQDVQDAVASAGYLAAATTRPPGLLGDSICSYSWPRTGIAPGESLARFAAVLRGPRLGIVR